MAKQPRSLAGKVAVVTGGGRGIGKAISRSLAREGVRVAIADLDAAVAEAGRGRDRRRRDRPRPRRHRPPRLHRRARRRRAAARPDRRPRQQRRDHADRPVRGGDGRDRDPPARAQPPRRHPRLQGGDPAHEARAAPATSSTSPRSPASSARRAARPTRACKHGVVGLSESLRAELYGTGVEVHVVMPAFVNTELAAGTQRAQGRQALDPRGRRRGASSRRSSTGRFDVFVPKSLGRPRPLGRAAAARRSPSGSAARWAARRCCGADKGARAAYEARAAQSAPAAEAVVAEAAGRRAEGRRAAA